MHNSKIISGSNWKDPFQYLKKFQTLVKKLKRKKFKIAWSPTLGYAKPEKEVLEKLNKAIDNIKTLGHEVEEVDNIFEKDPVYLWNAEFYAGVGTKLKQVIEKSPDLIDPPILEVLKLPSLKKWEVITALYLRDTQLEKK